MSDATGSGAARGHIVGFDDLAPTEHSHEFVGAEHGDVPFSVILVHSRPGVGPRVHRHPYAEVFVVESGQATFRIGPTPSWWTAVMSWSARPARRMASSTAGTGSCG